MRRYPCLLGLSGAEGATKPARPSPRCSTTLHSLRPKGGSGLFRPLSIAEDSDDLSPLPHWPDSPGGPPNISNIVIPLDRSVSEDNTTFSPSTCDIYEADGVRKSVRPSRPFSDDISVISPALESSAAMVHNIGFEVYGLGCCGTERFGMSHKVVDVLDDTPAFCPPSPKVTWTARKPTKIACFDFVDPHPPAPPSLIPSSSRAPARGSVGNVLAEILWTPVLRPPRHHYSKKELNAMSMIVATNKKGEKAFYYRKDLQIQNHRQQYLECSHFLPMSKPASAKRQPCVVYLHGCSSCRLEARHVLEPLLAEGITVFCFDFAGSGRSEGEYVSLGYHEEQDLRVVLEHLRESPLVGPIALWGWSMGAVTAIQRVASDTSLAACVLDSPFSDFKELTDEVVRTAAPFGVPQFLIDRAWDIICEEAKARADFDPSTIKPLSSAASARTPAMFAVATGDKLTAPHHTESLYNAWKGEKVFTTFAGSHNSRRPKWFYESGAEFLVSYLKKAANVPSDDSTQCSDESMISTDPSLSSADSDEDKRCSGSRSF